MTTFDCRDKNTVEILRGDIPEAFRKKTPEPVCLRCGECCKWTYIGLRSEDYLNNEYCEALMRRGIRIFSQFGGIAVVSAPCMHLVEMPSGFYACSKEAVGRKPEDCKRYFCENDPVMKIIKLAKAMAEGKIDLRRDTQEEDARDIMREMQKRMKDYTEE